MNVLSPIRIKIRERARRLMVAHAECRNECYLESRANFHQKIVEKILFYLTMSIHEENADWRARLKFKG